MVLERSDSRELSVALDTERRGPVNSNLVGHHSSYLLLLMSVELSFSEIAFQVHHLSLERRTLSDMPFRTSQRTVLASAAEA